MKKTPHAISPAAHHIAGKKPCALLVSLLIWYSGACVDLTSTQSTECASSDDCRISELCRYGRCRSPAQRDRNATPLNHTTPHTPNTPNTESGAHNKDEGCVGRAPLPHELVVNELLVRVPVGEAGDANADGTRDAYDDEFLEIVNASEDTLSLSGVRILNNDRLKHRFSKHTCLAPLEAIVVFGGPKGAPERRHKKVLWITANTRLSMSNTAGVINLMDANGRLLMSVPYDQAPEQSLQLTPEITGNVFTPHPGGVLFSPGTCANGMHITQGCTPSTEEHMGDVGEILDMGQEQ